MQILALNQKCIKYLFDTPGILFVVIPQIKSFIKSKTTVEKNNNYKNYTGQRATTSLKKN